MKEVTKCIICAYLMQKCFNLIINYKFGRAKMYDLENIQISKSYIFLL